MKEKQTAWLSDIITCLNELFITDGLSDKYLINYAYTIRDKLSENEQVMQQIANNAAEQALLGEFARALDDAVMESSAIHQNQMMQYLNSKELQAGFQRLILDMLLAQQPPRAGISTRVAALFFVTMYTDVPPAFHRTTELYFLHAIPAHIDFDAPVAFLASYVF